MNDKFSFLKMFSLIVFIVLHVAAGHYCETPECPGFSLMKSLNVKEVNNEFIEIIWEAKEDYSIERYEVQWYTESGCLQCNGKLTLTNTSVKLSVKACIFYTIEVYAFEVNTTTIAPLIISQVTAPNPLINGTAVIIDQNWAIVRWLETCECPNSTHIGVCFGPNSSIQLQPSYPDNVVLFNFSKLSGSSVYVCTAYTLNSAGSSAPSIPVFFKTAEVILMEKKGSSEFVLIPIIIVGSLITVVAISILNKKGIIKIAWRRSYVVNRPGMY